MLLQEMLNRAGMIGNPLEGLGEKTAAHTQEIADLTGRLKWEACRLWRYLNAGKHEVNSNNRSICRVSWL